MGPRTTKLTNIVTDLIPGTISSDKLNAHQLMTIPFKIITFGEFEVGWMLDGNWQNLARIKQARLYFTGMQDIKTIVRKHMP